jgi:phosphoserine phosphatase
MGAPLETRHVAAVAAAIADHGANIDRIRRLSRYPVTTVELDVSGADVADLRHDLAMVAHQVGADIAVAPAGLARRGGRLVVMDVDSTLIQDEVIELLAEHAGRAAEVAGRHRGRHARRARLRTEPARPGRHAGRPARVGARRGA